MSMGWSLSSNTKEISCVQLLKCQVRERRMHSTGEASPWSHCLCLRRSTCRWWFWEQGSAPRSPPDQNVSPTTTSWPGSPRTWTGKQESVCGRIILHWSSVCLGNHCAGLEIEMVYRGSIQCHCSELRLFIKDGNKLPWQMNNCISIQIYACTTRVFRMWMSLLWTITISEVSRRHCSWSVVY